jgi:hypothetical protein
MDGFYHYRFSVPGTGLGGVAVDSRGDILVIIGGRIAVCDFRGSFLEYVEFDGFPGAAIVKVTKLCIDANDNRYVVDGALKVLAFDSDWNFRFAINKESFPQTTKRTLSGDKREESMIKSLNIGDVCVDDDGVIYVLDVTASHIYIFSPDGEYQRFIGEPGSTFTTLNFPSGVAIDNQGRVLVSDSTGHGLLGYSKEGRPLFALGGMGQIAGRFYFPRGVATDRAGRIYVVEPFLRRVQVLTVEPRPEAVAAPSAAMDPAAESSGESPIPALENGDQGDLKL